jgi:hypothetical protein
LKTVNSPNPGNVSNGLAAVTALSDGTVAAVGSQVSSTTGQTPLILQNAASAPKAAALIRTTPAAPNAAPVPTAGTATAAQIGTIPVGPGAAPVDQSFAAVVTAVESISSVGHHSRAAMPVHHHHSTRLHRAAVVGRFHTGHHWGADPATSTSFQVVAKFNNASFADTAAIADDDIWAVGSNSDGPLAVHFNGTNWKAVPTPTLTQPAAFAGVAAVASNDVWAVGYQETSSKGSDQPLIEHWDGTSWSVVSSPKLPQGGSLGAVTAISTNNVWAVGDSDNLSVDLVEHWDGTSWSVVSRPAFNGSLDVVYGVSADASHDVWAVGNPDGGLILHFDGTSWSRTVLPLARYGGPALFAVAALSPSNVWAVGMVRPSAAFEWRPLVEHWDGASWSVVSSPDPNPNIGYNLKGIAAISASDIWAAGTTGIEHWNGTSWSLVSAIPSGVSSPDGVAALSDGTVVVVRGSGAILEN